MPKTGRRAPAPTQSKGDSIKREQRITAETWKRVETYAVAYRLDPDALIEAAVTMCVPDDVRATGTPQIIEMHARARRLAPLQKEEE